MMPKSLVEDKTMLLAFVLFVLVDAIVFGVIVAFVLKQPPQQSASASVLAQWQSLDVAGQENYDKGELPQAKKQFDAALKLARSSQDKKLEIASLNELVDLASASGDLKGRAELLEAANSVNAKGKTASELLSALEKSTSESKAGQAVETTKITALCQKANDEVSNLLSMGDYHTARILVTKTKDLVDAALPANAPVRGLCLHNYGAVLLEEGDFSEAIAVFKQSLEFEAKSADLFGPAMASSYYKLGRAYLCSNDAGLAEKNIGVAWQMFRQLIGPRSKEVADCKAQLAVAYEAQGTKDRAIETARSAIEICEDKTQKEPDDLTLATAYNVIARAKSHVKPSLRALKLCERQIRKPYQLLCEILVKTSDLSAASSPEQAQALLNRAVAISKRFDKERSRLIDVDMSYVQGRIYFLKGDFALAKNAFEEALVARRNYYGTVSPHYADVLTFIATIHSIDGNVAKAEKSFEDAAEVLARCEKKDAGYPEASSFLKKEYGDWLIKAGRAADATKVRKVLKWSKRYNELKKAEG